MNSVAMATMDSDEKKLANSLPFTNIMQHTNEVKGSISEILGKVEKKGPSYSELLDDFSVLTAKLTTLSKTIANEKGREVQSCIVVPTAFSTEHDPQLVHLTEGRINCMQHELVPDYLRTKLDLDIEKEHKRLQDIADEKSSEEIQRQISLHNDIIESLIQSAEMSTIDKGDEELIKQQTQSDDTTNISKKVTRKLLMIQNKGKAGTSNLGHHK